jgi:hypothetical protein
LAGTLYNPIQGSHASLACFGISSRGPECPHSRLMLSTLIGLLMMLLLEASTLKDTTERLERNLMQRGSIQNYRFKTFNYLGHIHAYDVAILNGNSVTIMVELI